MWKYPKNKVLKLNKSLYGLKQSGREWNKKLDENLKQNAQKPLSADPCVHTQNYGKITTIVAIYVDDLIVQVITKRSYNR